AQSLKTLETFHAIACVERSDCDFNLAVRPPDMVDSSQAERRRHEVITASRKKYATARSEIEAELLAHLRIEAPAERPKGKATPSPIPKEAVPASKPPEPKPVVEEKAATESASVREEPKPPVPASDKGIGGHQHNLIRERIEAVAAELGYTASREAPTGSGGK